MKNLPALLLAATAIAQAQMAPQMATMSPAAPARPVPLVHGLGNSHHRIHTGNPQAQLYFNQGLDYIFAFNHDEARRSFERAAQLDPTAPMPLWGVALAVGPNYNDIDIGHAREQQAVDALRKARDLAKSSTASERDYIQALSERYAADTNHDLKVQGDRYSKAMAALVASYPNDLDAATLYAESLMDLNPWKLWQPDGKPAPNTQTIVSTLQGVIRRDPNHIGANHFLIHAVEASPDPSLALASAKRLETLAPGAGHLVHMPAHIYQRVGNFNGSALSNQQAIKVDQTYFNSEHIHPTGEMYYDMYYVHNIHFLASACSMEGNAACTLQAAQQLDRAVGPAVAKDKNAEWFLPTHPWMLVRFAQWNQILAAPSAPPQMTMVNAMWHYARGAADVALNRLSDADKERAALNAAATSLTPAIPPDFNNPAASALSLALACLDARIARANKQPADEIAHWRKAVDLLDTFAYNEPADWYYPVRESLGGALLRNNQPAEAEQVFRADLKQNPGSGRSLYGLWQSLEAQHKPAKPAQAAYETAWKHADTKLTINDL